MNIFIGLGNPTKEYQATRHNIGFDAITRLSDDYRIALNERKHKAVLGKGIINGHKVILVQPQTYMNLSGECVREVLNFYKLTPENIIVIYDDINLEVGHLRFRKKGSAGGHNGIKNIIQNLGTDEFKRIRIGVGEKPQGWDLADYVLGRFQKQEEEQIREALKKTSEGCSILLDKGFDVAMNLYNRREEK